MVTAEIEEEEFERFVGSLGEEPTLAVKHTALFLLALFRKQGKAREFKKFKPDQAAVFFRKILMFEDFKRLVVQISTKKRFDEEVEKMMMK